MKLYEFLEARKPEILGACLTKLRTEYPDQSDAERLDHIPAFLDVLIGTLRRDVGEGRGETLYEMDSRTKQELAAAVAHGARRHGQGLEIKSIVRDYGLVCNFVNDTAAKAGMVFDSREHQLMNVTLDTAIAIGIESYLAGASSVHQSRADALAELAHEVRNAASTARLAFDMIYEGRVGIRSRTAEACRRALARIGVLVQTTLVEAQLRAKVPPTLEPIRLTEFFARIVEAATPERGVRVAVEAPRDLTLDADRHLLSSAVTNLVQNALKFTRSGETIHLRGRQEANRIVIEVEDRCGGLPEGKADELFTPFVQRSDDRRGAGLGLHIARKAIVAHEGTIDVRNLPGVGCVFAISLPVASHGGGSARAA